MRTDEEILARIAAVKSDDMFGFEMSHLISRLSYDVALSSGVLKNADRLREGWVVESREREGLLTAMRGYIDFAWEKVLRHRGISAERNIGHYEAWIWLIGAAEHSSIDWDGYRNYGAPILMQVCKDFSLSLPTGSEGIAAANMAAGLRCRIGCDMGCGGPDPKLENQITVESVEQPQLPPKSS